MMKSDQEFQVSTEPWSTAPVHCHACGWNGTEKDLDHVFEENFSSSDEDDFHEADSKYVGANCPRCQEKLVFQCLECSWHGTVPVEGPEGFPTCPDCGTNNVTLQVKETHWQIFRQAVAVEAQLGFDFVN
jgi:Zn finger protein HypA/HybF involved in hydrogenase expression